MRMLWSNSKWLWATAMGLFYCLATCSGDSADCNDWPLLTTYKWTDKMFTCSGSITGFVMCNKGNSFVDVGISLWRGGNAYKIIVVYLEDGTFNSTFVKNFSDSNYLSFSSGDQLTVLVIYFNSSIRHSCSLPVEFIADVDLSCTPNKPKLYLKGTQDCFANIQDEDEDTTCPPQSPSPQPTQPVCTTTETDTSTVIGTTEVTSTSFTTITVESVSTETHYTTVTASYAIPNVSLMPCIDPPSMDSRSVQDAAQPPSTPSPGLVAAIVLGIVLVVLVMACAVAWVVCFKRKKRKLKADRSDGVNFSEVLQTHNSAELYDSPDSNEPQYEMTCTNTSAESLPEAQKSKNGYYTTTHQYSELPSAYLLEENHYWLPAATLSGIKAQIHQKAAHSLELQPESITLLEELGKGEFGMVYKGEWTSSPGGPVQVAVKTLHSQEEENRYKLLKEAAIMGQFSHPNVVRLYGVVDKPNKVMLIMEFLSRGDLLNHLNKCRCQPLQEDGPLQLLTFCREIADAMDYLSKKGFIHRDLAARNILLNEEYTAKIADFGLSHDMDEDYYYKPKGGMIPVKWTAPEAVLYKKYTTKSDVWSYGMVMYEIWSLGHKPFEEFNINQILKAFESGYCQPPPPGCPRNMYKLMVDCWNPDHHSRLTFEDITRELATDPVALLSWSQQDKATSSKDSVLGAPLEEGKHLYQELQNTYT